MDISVDCVLFGFDEKKLKVLLIEQRHAGTDRKLPKIQTALPGDLLKDKERAHQFKGHLPQAILHLWRPQACARLEGPGMASPFSRPSRAPRNHRWILLACEAG